MNWLVGWLREEFGRDVLKLNFYVPVSSAKLVGVDGKEIEDRATRYRKVKKMYLNAGQEFVEFRNGVYEVHAENEIYSDGHTHYYGVNAEDGSPVGFRDTAAVVLSPKTLKERLDNADMKGLARSVLGSNIGWVLPIVGVVAGVFIGITVAPYLPK